MSPSSFRASEARPGIQGYQRTLDSGFRRNDGVSDTCMSLKEKLFGGDPAESAEIC